MVNEHVRLLTRNAFNGRQQLDGFGDLLLESLGHHDFMFDIHLPTGQFGGQPRVLASLADGQ